MNIVNGFAKEGKINKQSSPARQKFPPKNVSLSKRKFKSLLSCEARITTPQRKENWLYPYNMLS
jgi:hypothetical protein